MDKIIKFFEDNKDLFNDCIEELDNYNGYLGDNRYYPMDELEEWFGNTNVVDILNRAFFGHDDETWTTDASGNKEYGAFNPNREYYYFNVYGNLVSADCKDYSAHLDHYVIEEMLENRSYIDSIDSDDELSALFDELEAEEEE